MLDAAAGEALKERGQQLALDLAGDWAERVVHEFRGWAAVEKARGMRTCTIERFRAEAQNHPATHKAWGSLPGLLVRAGVLSPAMHEDGSPVTRKAAAPKTHAHYVRVWHLL